MTATTHDWSMTDEQMVTILTDPLLLVDALDNPEFMGDYGQRLTNEHIDVKQVRSRAERLRYRTSPFCMATRHRYNPVSQTLTHLVRGVETTFEGRECGTCGRYELLRESHQPTRVEGT
ncbi:hypothetical protein [Aeromicrobium sp. 179-A 4D2 NHS]|uniref:hypothetical protein n=1 Tax=Aeromicrobium sp. 179-A 4D2 NHS TaxID=3142375 RepID=UPI0039A16B73